MSKPSLKKSRSFDQSESLESLLVLVSQDQALAFQTFVERTEQQLLRFLHKKTNGNEELAQDLAQNVYLQVHLLRDRYKVQYSAWQWLYVIASSQSRDQWRKQRTQAKVQDSIHEFNVWSQNLELVPNREWEEHLSSLATDERDLLDRRVFLEEDYSEIAKRLGQSEVSLRKKMSRILERLRLQFFEGKEK